MADPRVRAIRSALLRFYDAHRRDLPWRRTTDPYAVWVSEIMLQQTRVETVRRYYDAFLERFPTPTALAEASEDEVLSAWSGLGYYRRARLLHQGVKEVVERYGGEVPAGREERLGLPGVGRYTAGAIGSIAFGREEPIVDGNVARVLSRVLALETPVASPASQRALWAEAEALAVGPRPGDLNQALMELGATVCIPKGQPRCESCPISAWCGAREAGRETELPVPPVRRAPKRVKLAAVVALRAGCFWLVRGEEALFGGLFGVPMAEGHGRDAARGALKAAGLTARLDAEPLGHLEHVLTHRRMRVEVWRATAARGEESSGRRCLDASGLREVGVAKLTRRVLSSVIALDGETLELPLAD